MINKFVDRLQKIGITADLAANYPWIYITHINGIRVTEKFQANHGFTVFYLNKDGYVWSDRREVFKLIRKYLK